MTAIRTKQALSRLGALIVAVSLLSACEESAVNNAAGPGSNTPVNVTTTLGGVLPAGTSPFAIPNVNGQLKGDFWSAKTGERINLATGETKKVSNALVYPRNDGLEYVELIEEFRHYPNEYCGNSLRTRSTAFVIRDSITGLAKSFFEFRSRVSGPVRFSPDGQTIAFAANSLDPCDESYDYTYYFVDRDGEFILYANDSVVGLDWMPDSRAAFMQVHEGAYRLVIANERNSLDGKVASTLPALGGSPGRIRISPDGQQVLIEVVSGTPSPLTVFSYREATVWQMNIDGTNLRKIADTSRESPFDRTKFAEPLINEPVWSPDGQHIIVTENFKSGVNTSFLGTQTENHAYIEAVSVVPVTFSDTTLVMPSNTDFVRLPPASYSPEGVRPLFAVNEWGRVGTLGVNPTYKQAWTPTVPQAQAVVGDMPAPNGLVNRGMTGKQYYFSGDETRARDEIMAVTDMSTGTTSSVDLKLSVTEFGAAEHTWAFDVSTSGNRIAALHKIDRREYDEIIALYDGQGNPLKTFDLQTDSYNYTQRDLRIRFSPVNEKLVAWKYFANRDMGVVIADTENNKFLKNFNSQNWHTFAWLNDGGILLFRGRDVYASWPNASGFTEPLPVFTHTESFPLELSVSPNGQYIAYSGTNGDLYIVGTTGTNYRRVISRTTQSVLSPSWSPDSKYISVRTARGNHIVSAGAQNLRFYPNYTQHGIMPVNESSAEELDVNTTLKWR